jgi:hypothetical protein
MADAKLFEGLIIPTEVVYFTAMQVHLLSIGNINILVLEHPSEELSARTEVSLLT